MHQPPSCAWEKLPFKPLAKAKLIYEKHFANVVSIYGNTIFVCVVNESINNETVDTFIILLAIWIIDSINKSPSYERLLQAVRNVIKSNAMQFMVSPDVLLLPALGNYYFMQQQQQKNHFILAVHVKASRFQHISIFIVEHHRLCVHVSTSISMHYKHVIRAAFAIPRNAY